MMCCRCNLYVVFEQVSSPTHFYAVGGSKTVKNKAILDFFGGWRDIFCSNFEPSPNERRIRTRNDFSMIYQPTSSRNFFLPETKKTVALKGVHKSFKFQIFATL